MGTNLCGSWGERAVAGTRPKPSVGLIPASMTYVTGNNGLFSRRLRPCTDPAGRLARR